MRISHERMLKLERVAANRQFDLTVVLENVHDTHNIAAIMRSCDCVGVYEIFVLYTEPQLNEQRLKIGSKTSGGASRWIPVRYYRDVQACIHAVRERYARILCAMPSPSATSLWDIDLTRSTALIFGNERDGISSDLRELADGDFLIPMEGMAMSLNVSVACALTLYEAYRQRYLAGAYQQTTPSTEPAKQLMAKWIDEQEQRYASPAQGGSESNQGPW